jgi:hypothetical protein
VRHALRDRLAWHLATTLGLEPGSLTKPIVDLLWSGGGLTKTGAQADLALARRAGRLLPGLALLGYAAGSDLIEGTLRVSDLILSCEENAWRLPTADPHPAAWFRSEEFGTRVDQESSPAARMIEISAEQSGATNQMIYSLQVLKPGAVLMGDVQTTPAATRDQEQALQAALALWAPGGVAFLGAKTAVGYGRAHVEFSTPPSADALAGYTQHVLDSSDEIRDVLRELTA